MNCFLKGAVSFEEREAPAYDEKAMKEAQKKSISQLYGTIFSYVFSIFQAIQVLPKPSDPSSFHHLRSGF